MAFLRSVWSDVRHGRNIEVYLALALGVAATLIGIGGGTVELIVAITSGTLALIAFGMLQNRSQYDRMQQTLNQLDQVMTPTDKVVVNDQIAQEISPIIKSAQHELLFLLRTGNTLRAHTVELEGALQRGCRIRIVLCNTDEMTVRMNAFRGYSLNEEDAVRTELRQSLLRLAGLARRCAQNQYPGRLEVRTVAYVPSVTLYMSDTEDDLGGLFAPITPFRAASAQAPALRLVRARDRDLFTYFLNQFEQYWSAAQPVEAQADSGGASALGGG